MAQHANGRPKPIGQILEERTAQIREAAAPDALHWQTWPADMGRRAPWEVFRIPQRGVTNVVILSGTITGHDTHYWGGRTMPCLRDGCIACDKGRGKEWHGYFFATGTDLEALWLFEVPSSAAPALSKYFDAHRTMRGCLFDARRQGGRKNGPVAIYDVRTFGDPKKLPKPPQTRPALLRLWQVARLDVLMKEEATEDELIQSPNGDH